VRLELVKFAHPDRRTIGLDPVPSVSSNDDPITEKFPSRRIELAFERVSVQLEKMILPEEAREELTRIT